MPRLKIKKPTRAMNATAPIEYSVSTQELKAPEHEDYRTEQNNFGLHQKNFIFSFSKINFLLP